MIGVMHPLESIDSGADDAQSLDHLRGPSSSSGAARATTQPQNEFEQNYANYPAETVEQIRNQVSLSAIKALIVHMGGLKEGRKALILVSEGYSNILPPRCAIRSPRCRASAIRSAGMPSAGAQRSQRGALSRSSPDRTSSSTCRASTRWRARTTSRSIRSIRAGCRSSSSTSTKAVEPDDRQPVPRQHAEHAAGARARDRRPRDPEPQRSRRRHEADHRATRAPTISSATPRRRRRPTASSTRSPSRSSGPACRSARGRDTGR